MDVSNLMERMHGGSHFGHVEKSVAFREVLEALEQMVQIATRTILHGEIKVSAVLEGIVQAHHVLREATG